MSPLRSPTPSHPLQRAWHAHELLRLRSSSDQLRAGAALRAGRVDPNPHQIEAVRFALERLPEGGAVLADEVGLGKTIEAGLVAAQRLAEGAQRILLLAPKPLIGQWRQELETLFGLHPREGVEAWGPPGVVLLGREAATSGRGLQALLEGPEPDLLIVDEAHEIFSGLHQRFDKAGLYLPESSKAARAGALYEWLRSSDTPVLLLTATPVQNSLLELWSLAQYIDRSGTCLGTLPTFRTLFSADSRDRALANEAEPELRRRLREVVQRTLRRQAQEFLPQPFVDRHARTLNYRLSDAEKALSDDVSDYLLTPRLAAFGGRARRLLLIGFHRRMASSRRALAQSLDMLERRLQGMLSGQKDERLEVELQRLAVDVEPGEDGPLEEDEATTPMSEAEIRAELVRVQNLASRARGLEGDAKLEALRGALGWVVRDRSGGSGSGKMVIFTESLATQAYLHEALLEEAWLQPEDITLFNGSNQGARAREALERWQSETQSGVPVAERPHPDVALRLALVHELKTRSKVLIASEAGAKGLNLQFCETVVNYDLPWNPQRIEQRIGRCHRYGQTRSVTVINFVAENNEAETLLFEILQTKLDLFEQVLGASDQVLGVGLASALGSELEASLREIHERARTRDEIVAAMRALRDQLSSRREAFEKAHQRTSALIDSTFDEGLRSVFRGHAGLLGAPLGALDEKMQAVLEDYLGSLGVAFERGEDAGGAYLRVEAHPGLPEGFETGFEVGLGAHRGRATLHLGHPLLDAARASAAAGLEAAPSALELKPEGSEWDDWRGKRARAALVQMVLHGYERVDVFVPVVVFEGASEALPEAIARGLLSAPMTETEALGVEVDDVDFEDMLEARVQEAALPVEAAEGERHARRVARLERAMDERCRVLGRQLKDLHAQTERLREERDAASGSARRAELEARVARSEAAQDEVRSELERLRIREDEDYRRLRARDLARRFEPPVPQRLFDVELWVR